MKKKLAALLLSIGMLTEMACPIIAVPTELQTEMTTQTNNDNTDVFLVPVEQKTEVPDGYIGIYTIEDLDNVRNDLDANYILMNDIDLSAYENWVPIGKLSTFSYYNYFRGIFDGNGHSIQNAIITYENQINEDTSNKYFGLFTYNKGTIINLALTNIKYTIEGYNANMYIGGIVAISEGIIDNCTVDGRISGTESDDGSNIYIGGIVCSDSGTLEVFDCANYSSIIFKNNNEVSSSLLYDTNYVGGIISNIQNGGSKVSSCVNYGTITIKNEVAQINAGGIIGFISASNNIPMIEFCMNKGNINVYANKNAFLYLGGIVGQAFVSNKDLPLIFCSTNDADINIYTYDYAVPNDLACGGICGHSRNVNITNCYNTGDITIYSPATYKAIGGICGKIDYSGTTKINYCYNKGEISDLNGQGNFCQYGGIIGGNKTLTNHLMSMVAYSYYNNYELPTIAMPEQFLDINLYEIIDCAYLTDTEMQSASSFVGFDFDTVWEIGVTEGYPYPTLRDNPHRGSYHPAPRLTVTPGTTAVQTQFMFDKSLCQTRRRFLLKCMT